MSSKPDVSINAGCPICQAVIGAEDLRRRADGTWCCSRCAPNPAARVEIDVDVRVVETGGQTQLALGEDIRTDGGQVARCRECGAELGAGYLCDDCDTVEGWE